MPVRNHIVEVLHRGLPQAVDVIRRRRRKSALRHHAASIAEFRMTGRAVDPKAFLSALQESERHGRRLVLLVPILHNARWHFGGADIRRIRLLLGLIDHIVAATKRYKHCLLYTSPSPRDRQKSRM